MQLLQALWSMVHPQRSNLAASLVNHQGVVVGICSIDTCIPHVSLLSRRKSFLGQRVLILRCSFKARSSNGRSPQERHQGSAICSNRSSRGKGIGFPWWVQQLRTASIGLAEALKTGAYKHITCIRKTFYVKTERDE